MLLSGSFLAGALALVTVCEAAPTASNYVLHEKRNFLSSSWTRRGRLEPNAKIPMKIGLKQQNLHLGYNYLLDV
jgi:tripeptidyl-peptidase-1